MPSYFSTTLYMTGVQEMSPPNYHKILAMTHPSYVPSATNVQVIQPHHLNATEAPKIMPDTTTLGTTTWHPSLDYQQFLGWQCAETFDDRYNYDGTGFFPGGRRKRQVSVLA